MRSYCFACFCLCTFLHPIWQQQQQLLPKCCAPLCTHTHTEHQREARSLVLRLRSVDRSHSYSHSNWLSLSLCLPLQLWFLASSLNFCCLRSVQLLTSRLWVRNRLKRSAARACFQINLIIRTSLVVAALPLRCCCCFSCCTCCCRVCHSQNSIRLNF